MAWTRRKFLQTSAAGLSALAASRLSATPAGHHVPLGVQLFTVKTLAEADLPKVLAQIRQIGYEEVELYWNVYTHPAAELRRMIADAGLRAPSGHFEYKGLSSKLDYAHDLGLEYMICPMMPPEMRTSPDGFKAAAEQFNRWGDEIQTAGMKFGFHNHNYEFRHFDRATGFDILMKNTEAILVKLEMDCYWITQAGRDPIQMLHEYRGRIRMLHLKDRQPGFPTSQELRLGGRTFYRGRQRDNWLAKHSYRRARARHRALFCRAGLERQIADGKHSH